MKTASGPAQKIVTKSISGVLLPSGDTHICILVFVDSLEVEGLIVDEELCTRDVDGANTHRQCVVIHISTLRCELNLGEPQTGSFVIPRIETDNLLKM